MQGREVRFDGKVAIVTGAGGGIGEAVALELAKRGAAVVVNDYGGDIFGKPGSIDRAAAVAARIEAAGARALADCHDVAAPDSADAIVDAAVARFGHVDLLVNNAGVMGYGAFDNSDPAAFDHVVSVHLRSSQALMRRLWTMLAQRRGRVVNMLSSLAFGLEDWSNYAAAKSGLMGLTRAAGREGKRHGIAVNGILPTANTRMTRGGLEGPIRDWVVANFPPEKVAAPVVYLLSEEVAVSGEMFVAGGGRMARVGYAVAKGYFNHDISVESIAADPAAIMAMDDATIVFDSREELQIYYKLFPPLNS